MTRLAIKRRDGGFTLLETLISLTLVAMLAALATGGLRFGGAVWARAESHADAVIERQAAHRALRRILADARPLRPRVADRDPPVLFEGTPDRLRFVARLPGRAGPDAPQAVELARAADRMILRWGPLGDAAPDFDALGQIRRLSFNGRFRYVAAGVWREHWNGQPSLPDLVVFESDDAWPPLVVALTHAGMAQ